MISAENNLEKNLFKKLSRKSGKTIHEHSLLKPGDRVLVGLSGGKDSLVLLELLKDRWRAAPFQFEIFAAHVEISDSGYSANEQYLKSFCEDLNIPFFIERVSAGITEKPKKAPCFLCSWHRRKKLFDLTKTLNCNVLSFGHHRDDALETFMINLLHHGSVSSLPYKLRMFNGRIHLIRPLLDIWEDEIEEYSRLRGFNPINKSCSFENNNKRKQVREWIEIMNAHYSKSKINMFRALGNIYPEYLPGSAKNE